MNLFNKRAALARLYQDWLKNNPEVKDCPLNVISYLEGMGALTEITDELLEKAKEESPCQTQQ